MMAKQAGMYTGWHANFDTYPEPFRTWLWYSDAPHAAHLDILDCSIRLFL